MKTYLRNNVCVRLINICVAKINKSVSHNIYMCCIAFAEVVAGLLLKKNKEIMEYVLRLSSNKAPERNKTFFSTCKLKQVLQFSHAKGWQHVEMVSTHTHWSGDECLSERGAVRPNNSTQTLSLIVKTHTSWTQKEYQSLSDMRGNHLQSLLFW